MAKAAELKQSIWKEMQEMHKQIEVHLTVDSHDTCPSVDGGIQQQPLDLITRAHRFMDSVEECLSGANLPMDKIALMRLKLREYKTEAMAKVSTLQKNKLDLSRQEALKQQELLSQATEEAAALATEKEGLQIELEEERLKSQVL
eukprot:gene27247-33552_t